MAENGNAAVMREALVWMKSRMNAAIIDGSMDCYEALDKIEAALSAPARNCDVGTSADQARRFLDFCNANRTANTSCKETCPGYNAHTIQHCQAIWAQMPYEKGGAE